MQFRHTATPCRLVERATIEPTMFTIHATTATSAAGITRASPTATRRTQHRPMMMMMIKTRRQNECSVGTSSVRLQSYTGGMPGPMKSDDANNENADTIEGLRAKCARLESELATERTAKTMLENQLRACVSEVSKILAAKRELEMELRDATQSREGDE